MAPAPALDPRPCLYCRETKPAGAFNREHVLQDAFGQYEQAFVLVNVCTECNSYFDKNLDLKLGRESIEGLDRYEHGVKSPTEKTQFGRTSRLTARVNDGSFYQGAEVWWGLSDDGDRIVMRPFAQVGFEDDSGMSAWFRIAAIPTKMDLQGRGFAFPLTIKFFGIDEPDLADVGGLLVERGFTMSPVERGEGPMPAEIDIDIKGTIDRVLMRAVSKIAYNYLAYHYPEIAGLDQFAPIRRYVRYDEVGPTSPVSLIDGHMLAGLPSDRGPVAHCVAVEWQASRVVAQVQLFSRFRYRVVLADASFVLAPVVINKGHIFDPVNHQIVELTSDPRRGRPISELPFIDAKTRAPR